MVDAFVISRKAVLLLAVGFIASCVIIGLSCWYGKPLPNEAQAASKGDDIHEFQPGTAPWENLYLPKYTIPRHYDLTLYPDFYGHNSQFYGNVTIEVDVKQNTYYLLFHIKRLSTKVVSVIDESTGYDYGIEKQWGYERNQFWVTKTQRIINESSTVLLSVQFNGSLSDGIVGFYKAFYDNNTKAMATSKFEPVDARKAFPCFDEPNLKATFTVKLRHKKSFTALSNMPAVSSRPVSEELLETEFQKSVLMSTYLACFIVCECISKEKQLKSGKKFTVYAVNGREDQLDYSLDLGVNVTDYFESYFGLDYPLPKMDMIAIPDFVSGAMEHWGLITYRETNMLYKEGVTSPAGKQRVAEVITHELAHQWFGNIVTMDWWDDLWLNEGFATFMAYVGVEEVQPDMEIFSQFAFTESYEVMPEDSVSSSHPIIVPVKRPEEITAVFDAISYNKGAAVIRMLESFVGKANFKQGLKEYLKRYKYSNAKTYQLWESIAETAAGINVSFIMDTWTKQMGFPVVDIVYNQNNMTFTATQKHFKQFPNESWPASPYSYYWEVPLHYWSSVRESAENFTWLHATNRPVNFKSPVDLSVDGQWLKFNKEATGYYMVNYDTTTWQRLSKVLSSNLSAIPAGDRADLIYNSLTLASNGYMGYSTSLEFLNYMTNESHYVPWASAYSELVKIRNLLQDPQWDNYVVKLATAAYKKVAWNTDNKTHLDKLLGGIMIRLSCGHEYAECLNDAKYKFTQWLSDPNNASVDAVTRRDVLAFGMRNVTEEEWMLIWKKYEAETVASSKAELRVGLSVTQNETLINRLIYYSTDKTKIADQDYFGVVASLSSNPVALPILWRWLRNGDNYANIVKRFGIDHRSLGTMVPNVVSRFSTYDALNEVNDFFKKYPEVGTGERARRQAIQEIHSRIQWKLQNSDVIKQWLSNQQKHRSM